MSGDVKLNQRWYNYPGNWFCNLFVDIRFNLIAKNNYSTYFKTMLKAFGRALFITLILILVGFSFWYHPIITIIIIVIAWLTFMFFTDPPEKWD